MAASTMVSLSVSLPEYLETVYRPDRDWIDGEARERNTGEQPHASVQGFLSHLFRVHGKSWGVWALPEQRVQTSAEHYRVADLCVVRRSVGPEPVVRTPPLLCVEILSRDDRMTEMQERVEDYLAMGVELVWLIDPRRRRAYMVDRVLQREVAETLTVPGSPIAVSLRELFSELDEIEGKGAR